MTASQRRFLLPWHPGVVDIGFYVLQLLKVLDGMKVRSLEVLERTWRGGWRVSNKRVGDIVAGHRDESRGG
jgi:hypothetical protein